MGSVVGTGVSRRGSAPRQQRNTGRVNPRSPAIVGAKCAKGGSASAFSTAGAA